MAHLLAPHRWLSDRLVPDLRVVEVEQRGGDLVPLVAGSDGATRYEQANAIFQDRARSSTAGNDSLLAIQSDRVPAPSRFRASRLTAAKSGALESLHESRRGSRTWFRHPHRVRRRSSFLKSPPDPQDTDPQPLEWTDSPRAPGRDGPVLSSHRRRCPMHYSNGSASHDGLVPQGSLSWLSARTIGLEPITEDVPCTTGK